MRQVRVPVHIREEELTQTSRKSPVTRARSALGRLRLTWVRLSTLLAQVTELRVEAAAGKRGALARWLWYRRLGARLALITALAAGVTWWACSVTGISTPLIAAMSATLSVQAAVHASLKEGVTRIGATVVAILLAALVFWAIGIHAWSVMAVVGVALALGRLMGLGPEGAVQIPCTALVVFSLGAAMDSSALLDRIIGTLLGVVVGVTMSSLAHPTTPSERAESELGKASAQLSDLLARVAQGLPAMTRDEAKAWLAESRELLEDFERTRSSVEAAAEAARWGSRQARAKAKGLLAQARVLEHAGEQLNAIARSLFDDLDVVELDVVAPELAVVLAATGEAFAAAADMGHGSDKAVEALNGAVADVRDVRADALESVRRADDTGVWLLSGSILNNVDKMIDGLEGRSPGLEVGADTAPLPIIKAPLRRMRRTPS
jgi:uncharacterized membrane protein YgaE (UPF0421/DUF939 family)